MSGENKAITLQQAKTLYDDLRERQENIPSAENIVMVQDQQPTVPANKVWLTETPPAGVDVPTYQEFTGVIAPDYADLDFPVSAGEHCIHNGVLYTAVQNINASEAWTAAHWEAGSVSSKLTEISNHIQGVNDIDNLLIGELPGTTQTVTFDANDNPATITHSKDGTTVRTDVFTWGTNTVTEVRTAYGKYITITTDLTTLQSVISEVQEVA